MATSTPTKAHIQTELEDVRQALYRIQSEFHTFKQQVREIAIETAESEGWCKTGVNDVLDSLGLETLTNKFSVTATLEVTFEVELGADTAADDFDPESDLRSNLNLELNGWNDTWSTEDVSVVNVDWDEIDN